MTKIALGDAPRVTVLMSVCDGEKHLREAVESILAQTFTDFEFLIVNDGSTDRTRDILDLYHDERLRIVHQENTGLIRALNTGLHLARGEYVARMDADDVSHPLRLEMQIEVLDSNPIVDLVASSCRLIDEDGRVFDHAEMETDGIYRLWILQFRNAYVHGSVTYRRKRVMDLHGYSEKCLHAEDYDLWLRMTSAPSTAMIPTYLYDLRMWPESISQRFQAVQQRMAAEISCRALRLCDPSLTCDDLTGMRPLYPGTGPGELTIAGLKSLVGTLGGFCARYSVGVQDKATLCSRVIRDVMRHVMDSPVFSAEEKARIPEVIRSLTRDAIPREELLDILWDETIAVSNERNRLRMERSHLLVRVAAGVQRVLTRLHARYPAFAVVGRRAYSLLHRAERCVRRIATQRSRERTHPNT
jgi:hypothetical protein